MFMNKNSISVSSILVLAALILFPGTARAVEEFRVSSYGNGVQVWFEAEAFDERSPEGDRYYKIAGENAPDAPDGAFGEAITRSGGAGGMILWNFNISKARGVSGPWHFWARIINPNNRSDYMLVLGDSGDEIPEGPPFPGGDGSFDNEDDRVFEDTVETWEWWGREEGSIKELQDGENSMYILHREGDSTVFWDVFMWTDDFMYSPSDADYRNATPKKGSDIAVLPLGKLPAIWGGIKKRS
jgi:hypothetical protein